MDIMEQIKQHDEDGWVSCQICGWGDPPEYYLLGLCAGCVLEQLVTRGAVEVLGFNRHADTITIKPEMMGKSARGYIPAAEAKMAEREERQRAEIARRQARAKVEEAARRVEFYMSGWQATTSSKADASWMRYYPDGDGHVTGIIMQYGNAYYAQIRGKGGAQQRLGKGWSFQQAEALVEGALAKKAAA